MIFISLRFYKHYIIPHWIPLLSSESMTTRYMIIPLLILTFIATINLNDYLIKNKKNIYSKIIIYFVFILSLLSIINNSRIWRMHRVQNENDWYNILTSSGSSTLRDITIYNNYNDKIYIYLCWMGVGVSLVRAEALCLRVIFNFDLRQILDLRHDPGLRAVGEVAV